MNTHGEYINDLKCFTRVAGISYEQAEDLILASKLRLEDDSTDWPVPAPHQFAIYAVENRLAFALSHDGDWLRIYVGHVNEVHAWAVLYPAGNEDLIAALKNEMDK